MLIKNHFFFYWLYRKNRFRHIYNIGSGLFIWLFWLGTLPFGLYANNFDGRVDLALFLFPFGLAWVLISYIGDFVFDSIVTANPRNSHPANFYLWIGKISVQIHIYYVGRGWLCEWDCMNFHEYAELWMACTLLFLLTYIPFSLYGRYAYFHSLVGVNSSGEGEVTLLGEGKETLTLPLDHLICIQSDDNYVDLFLADDDDPGKKIVFRCTLKSITEQLAEYPQFVRTHRSVLANIRYIVNPGSSNQSLKSINLVFKKFSMAVPLSRSYRLEVEELLIHPK